MHLPVVTEEEAIEMDNKNRQEQLRQLQKWFKWDFRGLNWLNDNYIM
jgi:hypothetical protein